MNELFTYLDLFAGESALHLACAKHYDKLVQNLLNLEANPNLLTSELRQSPLHYAVKHNAENCIRAFIESNQDVIEGRWSIVNRNKKVEYFNVLCIFNFNNRETPYLLVEIILIQK